METSGVRDMSIPVNGAPDLYPSTLYSCHPKQPVDLSKTTCSCVFPHTTPQPRRSPWHIPTAPSWPGLSKTSSEGHQHSARSHEHLLNGGEGRPDHFRRVSHFLLNSTTIIRHREEYIKLYFNYLYNPFSECGPVWGRNVSETLSGHLWAQN